MDLDELMAETRKLRPRRRRGRLTVNQPVVLLWAARRAVAGESRQVRWSDVRSTLSEAISELGGGIEADPAAVPVLALAQSPLGEIEMAMSAPHSDSHAARWLNSTDPHIGLSSSAFTALHEVEIFEDFAHTVVEKFDEPTARAVLDYFGVQRPLFRGIGEVPGVEVGDTFASRAELHEARVHRALQAGIVGTADKGAESIVVSGGYEDKDYDDWIIYTGHGGWDRDTGKQVADQSPTAPGNAGLITSSLTKAPVRVIRGAHEGNPHAPATGFRYDGLFMVERFWQEPGEHGFSLCRYRLVRLAPTAATISTGADAVHLPPVPSGNSRPGRKLTAAERIVRDVEVVRFTKAAHDCICQICEIRMVIQGRGYAQGAHIRPLGEPHGGPDTPDNMLCLCPNCHVLFDNGEILVDSDLRIISEYPNRGTLRTAESHVINPEFLEYHRGLYPTTKVPAE
ncbi:hypothetical protein GCM10010168_42970 [Actinoplanes ianthinogenes]|uniref:YDG domain-containing protein n=1 Tax=Actinoplanes ianthinogenes TaxID=122358 RepID=A0ABM7LVM7_9ACTN|nr:YDG/SRA domain-containing protein [Actinoplanes ianthinogenes]BCJ43393.1 hypothetical protein Aiant_40500 [Actinoplanes ianthinogenes]GGR20416.1 hypothetical protein GCM10010168_42970 [Actinoplanes ianthinogenes]